MAAVALDGCSPSEKPAGVAETTPPESTQISLEQCKAALDQYVSGGRFALGNGITGLECDAADGGGLELLVLSDSEALPLETLPCFTYKYGKKDFTLPVRRTFAKVMTLGVEPATQPGPAPDQKPATQPTPATQEARAPEAKVARATPVSGGDSASYSNQANPSNPVVMGTAGLNIIFNGNNNVVCLGCAHAMCKSLTLPIPNNPPQPVFLGGQNNATLYSYQPVTNGPTCWDFAMARYNDPNMGLATMKACPSGPPQQYPTGLAACVNIGDHCHRVGFHSACAPINPVFGLTGVISVTSPNGTQISLNNQVVFKANFTTPPYRDSGAVVVNDSGGIVGVECAARANRLYACPLYKANWNQVTTPAGAMLSFTANLSGPTNGFDPTPKTISCP